MSVSVSNFSPDDVPGQLQTVVGEHDSTVTLALTGEWDLAAQPATREAIGGALALDPERVVLDLSQLTFMDSTGIHAAVELYELALLHNVHLEIIPGPRTVQRLFEICQLTNVLPFRRPHLLST